MAQEMEKITTEVERHQTAALSKMNWFKRPHIECKR
jgi:hypothetical protein